MEERGAALRDRHAAPATSTRAASPATSSTSARSGALTSIPYRFTARPWDVTNTPSVCGDDADRPQRGADAPRGPRRPRDRPPRAELRGGGGLALRPRPLRLPGQPRPRPPHHAAHPRRRPRPRVEPRRRRRRGRRWCSATAAASASWSARRPRWRRASSPRSWRAPRSPARWSSGSASPAHGLEALRSQPAGPARRHRRRRRSC